MKRIPGHGADLTRKVRLGSTCWNFVSNWGVLHCPSSFVHWWVPSIWDRRLESKITWLNLSLSPRGAGRLAQRLDRDIRRILVIDDDPRMASLLTLLTANRRAGVEIIWANNRA